MHLYFKLQLKMKSQLNKQHLNIRGMCIPTYILVSPVYFFYVCAVIQHETDYAFCLCAGVCCDRQVTSALCPGAG